MRPESTKNEAHEGYALLMVMAVTAVATIALAATMGRTMTNAKMNNRSNEYSVTGNAAEAAVEKVVTRMGYDFQNYGLGAVYGNLSLYQNSTPNEDTYWNDFAFSDGDGHANQTYVATITTNYAGALPSEKAKVFQKASSFGILAW